MPRGCKKRVSEMLEMFGNGSSIRDICMKFGLSETGYYYEVRKYPTLQKSARKRRETFKKANMPKIPKPQKVNLPKSNNRRTSSEKIKHLEERLQREKAKNADLEKLLKLAKESLGKL